MVPREGGGEWVWSHEREGERRGLMSCLFLILQLTTLTRLTRSLKNDPGLQDRRLETSQNTRTVCHEPYLWSLASSLRLHSTPNR